MIAAVLTGCLVGAGLLAVVWRLLPLRPSPVAELARFEAAQSIDAPIVHGPGTAPAATGLARRQELVGRWAARQLARRGIQFTTLRQDLALLGRTYEQTLGRKITLTLTGLLLAAAVTATSAQVGSPLPTGFPLLLAVLLAGTFFWMPDLEARREAARRREEFRKSLSGYLDLVQLEMAGEAAPAEALPSAANLGESWPFALIRATIYRARQAGRSPWLALADLGDRIGVRELYDLGQLINLVAHDGARVRSTLAARAQTMRRRELADLQVQAGRADQSLRMTQIIIGLGFVLFIGYPAIVAILAF
jgi:Flp pilus assembly protein TadB